MIEITAEIRALIDKAAVGMERYIWFLSSFQVSK